MFESAQDWENFYLTTDPSKLPWDAGGPDPDLVRHVEAGTVTVGQALDLGTGSGHDVLYLLEKGFMVMGIDISQSAVVLTRERVSQAGHFGFFQQGDLRELPVEDSYVDFAHDRGCWHTLDQAGRQKALQEIHRVLKRRGLFLVRVFKSPPENEWPHAFTRSELEQEIFPYFTPVDWTEGLFVGPSRPSYSVLLRRK